MGDRANDARSIVDDILAKHAPRPGVVAKPLEELEALAKRVTALETALAAELANQPWVKLGLTRPTYFRRKRKGMIP